MLRSIEEHEVNIRVRSQFTPPIAAQRHKRNTGRIWLFITRCRIEIQEDFIRHIGQCGHDCCARRTPSMRIRDYLTAGVKAIPAPLRFGTWLKKYAAHTRL